MLCSLKTKVWNLANHMKKWSKKHQTLSFQFFISKSSILMLFVLFFHVVCKISNFYKWTAKHLAQASCTELTLSSVRFFNIENKSKSQQASGQNAGWVGLGLVRVLYWLCEGALQRTSKDFLRAYPPLAWRLGSSRAACSGARAKPICGGLN